MSNSSSSRPYTALVFCVHGMGPSEGTREKVELLAQNVEIIAELNSHSNLRVKFVPIEWHNYFREFMQSELDACTLDTVPYIRAINNEKLADILLYTNQSHRLRNHLRDLMTREFTAFTADQPDFAGQVYLIGHSLGGIACHDLVTNIECRLPGDAQEDSHLPLPFAIRSLIILGSPFAAMNIFRNLPFHVPDTTHIYNVFHPYDPMAYRAEPRISSAFQSIPPVLLAHYRGGGKKLHMHVRDSVTSLSRSLVGLHNSFPSVTSSFSWEFLSSIFAPGSDREELLNSSNTNENDDATADATDEKEDNMSTRSTRGGSVDRTLKRTHSDEEDEDEAEKNEEEEEEEEVKEEEEEADSSEALHHRTKRLRSASPTADTLSVPTTATTAHTTATSDDEATATLTLPASHTLSLPNGQDRLDYVLQQDSLEMSAPHLFSGVTHVRYWANKDVALFLTKVFQNDL